MMIKDRRRDRVDWTVVQWCVGQPVLTGEVVGGPKGTQGGETPHERLRQLHSNANQHLKPLARLSDAHLQDHRVSVGHERTNHGARV